MGQVALDIDPGRTGQLARGQAIPVVLFQKEFQDLPTGLDHRRRVGPDGQAFRGRCGAGGDQSIRAPDFDHADSAGLLRLQQREMA